MAEIWNDPDAPFEYVKDVAEGADIDIIIHLYPATSKAFYPVETLIKNVQRD